MLKYQVLGIKGQVAGVGRGGGEQKTSSLGANEEEEVPRDLFLRDEERN